jgi:hypothetical protein
LADTIGLLQERYGWDDNYILSIPYARLLQNIRQAQISKINEVRKIAYQCYEFQLPFRDPKKTLPPFDDYFKLAYQTIYEDEFKNIKNGQKIDIKEVKEKAIKRSEEILAMFAKREVKK